MTQHSMERVKSNLKSLKVGFKIPSWLKLVAGHPFLKLQRYSDFSLSLITFLSKLHCIGFLYRAKNVENNFKYNVL